MGKNKELSVGEVLRKKYIDKVNLFNEICSWTDEDYEMYRGLLDKLKDVNNKKTTNKKKTSVEDVQKTKDKGDALEATVNFIIEKSFFLKVYPNIHTSTNEIDQFIILSDYGKQAMYEEGFSSELLGFKNGYFLGECKNYNDSVGATWIGKFYTLLTICGDCDLGIIFSYNGLSGQENNWYDAHGLTKIIYRISPEENKTFILDFNLSDFELLLKKDINFFDLIKGKKETLRSGAKSYKFIEKHDAESFVKETRKILKLN